MKSGLSKLWMLVDAVADDDDERIIADYKKGN